MREGSVPTPAHAGEGVQVARAPWAELPELVAEVEELRSRFEDPALSVAQILCDAHDPTKIAFTVIDQELRVEHLTYGELADRSRRLAHALQEHGVERGSRVAVLMGKSRQLPIVLLACWRLGAVIVPLFTAFAAPAVLARVKKAGADLVVADPDQRAKLEDADVRVLETGPGLDELADGHDALHGDVAIGSDGLFIQLYTSGTTGVPKAVGVPAFAIGAFISYMRYGLDLSEQDVFWNAADPGWAYGLYFGIVGPLAVGQSNILLRGKFSPPLTKRCLDALRVTNFAASPTVYRALKKEGVVLAAHLRVASSAGEPLTPDVTAWAPEALGTQVRDHWGQTEQGMAVADLWDVRLRHAVPPGSMGTALPGFTAGIVHGSLALSLVRSPLMWFNGYVDAPQQTKERFTRDGAWYLTGDTGRLEGPHLFFSARDDDVILAAGYRIAPFDIESIIAKDPSVAEVAVVGRPDPLRGEAVEAFIVPVAGSRMEGLEERVQRAVREGYGAHAYPRKVHVVEALPRTASGKVQRFLLREAPTNASSPTAAPPIGPSLDGTSAPS